MNYKPSQEQIELICKLQCEVNGTDPDDVVEVVTQPPQPMNREGTAFLAVYIQPTREHMPRWKSMVAGMEAEAIRYNILRDVLDPNSLRNLERMQKLMQEYSSKQKRHPGCGCPMEEQSAKPEIDAPEDVAKLVHWLYNETNIITLGYFPQLPDHDTVVNDSEYIQCESIKHVEAVACTLVKDVLLAPYYFSYDYGVTWSGPVSWTACLKAVELAKQKNPAATTVNPNMPLKGI